MYNTFTNNLLRPITKAIVKAIMLCLSLCIRKNAYYLSRLLCACQKRTNLTVKLVSEQLLLTTQIIPSQKAKYRSKQSSMRKTDILQGIFSLASITIRAHWCTSHYRIGISTWRIKMNLVEYRFFLGKFAHCTGHHLLFKFKKVPPLSESEKGLGWKQPQS